MFYMKKNTHNDKVQVFVVLDAGVSNNGTHRYVAVLQPGSFRDEPQASRVTEPVVCGMDATMMLSCTPVRLRQKACIPEEALKLAERMRGA